MTASARLVWVMLAASVSAALLAAGCSTTYTQVATTDQYAEPQVANAYENTIVEDFDELSAYGVWTVIEPFGYVWRPTVVSSWRPYIYGHWIWSNWGWTWISYEPFGWAVYHYGYWQYDPIWGWLWLPGDKWFSARVKWMVYDDYVCWAPAPPPGYYIGDPWRTDVPFIWNAVPAKNFTSSNVYNFTVRPPRPTAPLPEDDYTHRREPKPEFIEKHTNKTIKPTRIDVREVKTGSSSHKRMVLPPDEKRRVEHQQPRVEKRVTPDNPDSNERREETGRKSSGSSKTRSTRSGKTKRRTEPD